MSEEKGVVKYQARDGQEVTLSFENVKKYLVAGNSQAVTNQELMYFLGVCKSRGLNPFKKDAYLIKYGNDPAAIITSIDYFRSRARAQKDCIGWKKGIIVQRQDGSLRDSAGIILDEEKLIGGFFEATPEGWKTQFRLEVNLKGYIKKTKDGNITRFWQEDNQPTMIAKVAEGQGLRTLWPDEFQGIYEESEIKAPAIDMSKVQNGSFKKAEPLNTSKFVDLIDKNCIDEELPFVDKYIKLSAKATGKTENEIQIMFAEDFEDSLKNFREWYLKQSAAPGDNKPGEQPTTKTTEDLSGAEAKTTEKKDQGPQSSDWDPYGAEIQGRYVADKTDILKAELNKKGLLFTSSMTGKELHELLLESLLPQDDEEPETERAAAHKKMLDEKEAKRKALYGNQPREDHEVIKTDGDFDENAPQKMADDPKPVSKNDLRDKYIAILEQAGKIDRGAWMKSKQQVGLLSTPNLETLPIEKLVEWATLAKTMTEGEKDIQF